MSCVYLGSAVQTVQRALESGASVAVPPTLECGGAASRMMSQVLLEKAGALHANCILPGILHGRLRKAGQVV